MNWPGRWQELQRRWTSRGACCTLCGSKEMGPVLENDTWMQIAKAHELIRFLCEPCMVKRLGRNLKKKDFQYCPWNTMRNKALGKRYV